MTAAATWYQLRRRSRAAGGVEAEARGSPRRACPRGDDERSRQQRERKHAPLYIEQRGGRKELCGVGACQM